MQPDERSYHVEAVSWTNEAAVLRAIRHQVFVVEQGVPETLEWDGRDPDCVHVLARDCNGAPIGTGRLLPDAHIGRMAVLEPWRRAGVGSVILRLLVEIARARGDRVAILSAQSYVLDFYRRAGFEVTSEEYLEAGIRHREMRLLLQSD
jgi:predicted GNAT family N-acyltransferase